eukprot:TRINITY_DN25758_c0_g2_i1.p1 TRINITY_DN25758_c0_g2~~TRINITY_DN25758_c0_g2_i1.p1  ORF type:complete len:471 (+),score=82.88 TRINITY_DN25758_c0_g2_i1:140-1552(+)
MPIVGDQKRQRLYINGQLSHLCLLGFAWFSRVALDVFSLTLCRYCHVADFYCCCFLAWRWLCRGRLGGVFEKFSDEQVQLDKRYKDIFPAISKGLYVLLQPRRFSSYLRITSRIGKGGYGTIFRAVATNRGVRLVEALEPGRRYAVKYVPKKPVAKSADTNWKSFNSISAARHIEFFRLLNTGRSDHIVRFFVTFIEMPDKLFTVMELLEGPDLMAWLIQRACTVPEVPVADITQQMLSAVHYLHAVIGILHRDVKPENFGFARPVPPREVVDALKLGSAGRGSSRLMPTLKMFDFGMVWILDAPVRKEASKDLMELSPVGTRLYIAPECWAGRCGPQSDVWAVGLSAYLLLSGMLPFGLLHCGSDWECKRALRLSTLLFEADAWEYVSEPAIVFLSGLLEKDPRTRSTTYEALESSWLQFPGLGVAQVAMRTPIPTSLKAQLDASWLSPEMDGMVWRSTLLASGTFDTR